LSTAQMIKLVVFDCFGTLVKLEPNAYFTNERRHAYNLLKAQKKDLAYDQFREAWMGTFSALEAETRITQDEFSMMEFAAKVQKKIGTNIGTELLVHTYLGEWVLGLSPIAGLAQSLERIRSRKQIAIISNTHHKDLVVRALEIAAVDPAVFDLIVTSVEVGKQKPHPAMMEKVLSELNVDPEETVMVGDSHREDFGLAKAARTKCLLIGGEQTPECSFEPGHYLPIGEILEVESKLGLDA